jgi:hypothetical protein
MLIISECKKCSKETKTCEIRTNLSKKLKDAEIKENLRYRCKNWVSDFSVGQNVEFDYLTRSDENREYGHDWVSITDFDKDLIKGVILEANLGKCIVRITAEEYKKVSDIETIKKHASPDCGFFDTPEYYTIPVRNEFIKI